MVRILGLGRATGKQLEAQPAAHPAPRAGGCLQQQQLLRRAARARAGGLGLSGLRGVQAQGCRGEFQPGAQGGHKEEAAQQGQGARADQGGKPSCAQQKQAGRHNSISGEQ